MLCESLKQKMVVFIFHFLGKKMNQNAFIAFWNQIIHIYNFTGPLNAIVNALVCVLWLDTEDTEELCFKAELF